MLKVEIIMKITDLKTLIFDDLKMSKFQQNIRDFTRQLTNNPLLKGIYLSGVEIQTTQTKINHGLERELQGYLILKKNNNSNVWLISSDNKTLEMQATAIVDVDIWVF